MSQDIANKKLFIFCFHPQPAVQCDFSLVIQWIKKHTKFWFFFCFCSNYMYERKQKKKMYFFMLFKILLRSFIDYVIKLRFFKETDPKETCFKNYFLLEIHFIRIDFLKYPTQCQNNFDCIDILMYLDEQKKGNNIFHPKDWWTRIYVLIPMSTFHLSLKMYWFGFYCLLHDEFFIEIQWYKFKMCSTNVCCFILRHIQLDLIPRDPTDNLHIFIFLCRMNNNKKIFFRRTAIKVLIFQNFFCSLCLYK